jgi:small-conductance mechanosensitive channel
MGMIDRLSKRGAAFARRCGSGTRALVLTLSIGGAITASMFCARDGGVHAQASAPSQKTTTPARPQSQPAGSSTGQGRPTVQGHPSADDVAGRSSAILAHLNAVLRFYRDSATPIQKVGEPSDLLYRDQAVTLASQIAGFAFQSAKAEAALLGGSPKAGQPAPTSQSQSQRLQAMRVSVEQEIVQLKAQDAALQKALATAKPKQVAALQQERGDVEGELELQTAMEDALAKIASMADSSNEGGFSAEIAQLERSAPGLTDSKLKSVPPNLDNVSAAKSAGVTSQAEVLFDLLGTRQAIDNLIREVDGLHEQAVALRTPLTNTLRSTIAQGQALSQQSAAATAAATGAAGAATKAGRAASPTSAAASANAASALVSTRTNFDALTATFKALSSASVPLSQEIVTLEEGRASLEAWRSAVNVEYLAILRSLLLRVAAIAVALLVIFVLGEVWRRATTRYVRDLRRRRQLLVLRRLAMGFLTGIVLIFGLVTQFNSLATFAGFITAGIAVGLQTILLSVAAYFFIIGRYGVKVGDRITITGVTGDVIEVGLVRFYMLEMAGSGTDLYPTGRVAVFSNAVLFQAGTPLYKQMPGTEYAWHEMTVKLSPDVDYRPVVQEILKAVQGVYEGYKLQIERQHKDLEVWMDSSIDLPGVQSNLQLVDGGLQFWVRFPVIIRKAASIDERMTESMLQLISTNQSVKSAVTAQPVIKAAVKG